MKHEEAARGDLAKKLKSAEKREKRYARVAIAALALILAVCLLPWPRSVDAIIPCVRWRSGQEQAEVVNVAIKGVYQDYLIWPDRFSGDLTIEGEEKTLSPYRLSDLHFQGQGGQMLAYQDAEGMLHILGEINAAPGMKEILILWYEENGSWSSDGEVIVGPAQTRDEAVALTRALTEKYNRGLTQARWEAGVWTEK